MACRTILSKDEAKGFEATPEDRILLEDIDRSAVKVAAFVHAVADLITREGDCPGRDNHQANDNNQPGSGS
jgi:hypothetical protein